MDDSRVGDHTEEPAPLLSGASPSSGAACTRCIAHQPRAVCDFILVSHLLSPRPTSTFHLPFLPGATWFLFYFPIPHPSLLLSNSCSSFKASLTAPPSCSPHQVPSSKHLLCSHSHLQRPHQSSTGLVLGSFTGLPSCQTARSPRSGIGPTACPDIHLELFSFHPIPGSVSHNMEGTLSPWPFYH